jgi:hypothetical protein
MKNIIPFNNYAYLKSKAIKNLGDSSVDSDSFNDMDDNKENRSFYYNLNNKNNSRILNPNKQIVIKKMIIKPKNFSINEHKTNYNLSRKDKDTKNKKIEKINKEYKFKAINKIKNINENKRYNGLDKLLKNNFKFLNDLNDDESDENEEIIDNEVTINFMEGFNSKNKKSIEKQPEIHKENILKINHRISDYNDNFFKLGEKKNDIIIGNSFINNKINKKNNPSFKFLENKKKNININILKVHKSRYDENYNFQNNKGIKLNVGELNKNLNLEEIKSKKIVMNGMKSIKSEGNNLNNNYFELVKYKYFFGNRNKTNQKKFVFNLTKKYKIFHKFLCLGIDTSGLYTLDDDMKNFILNPKITFDFPVNNLENELE